MEGTRRVFAGTGSRSAVVGCRTDGGKFEHLVAAAAPARRFADRGSCGSRGEIASAAELFSLRERPSILDIS